MHRFWLIALVAGAVLASNASASAPPMRTTKAPWSRPNEALALARLAGLTPRTHEFFAYHVHAHLDVFVNAHLVRVPAGIGIDIADPAVKRVRLRDGTIAFGYINRCATACISPLHTHDDSGIIHTESQVHRPNRLGEFFTEWRVRLTPRCVGGYCRNVRFYVDGRRYRADPRGITLTNHKDIVVAIGTPPPVIPSVFPQ